MTAATTNPTNALLAELGIDNEPAGRSDITVLRHVRPYVEIKAAEEIANHTPSTDFDRFKPLFEEAARLRGHDDLSSVS